MRCLRAYIVHWQQHVTQPERQAGLISKSLGRCKIAAKLADLEKPQSEKTAKRCLERSSEGSALMWLQRHVWDQGVRIFKVSALCVSNAGSKREQFERLNGETRHLLQKRLMFKKRGTHLIDFG